MDDKKVALVTGANKGIGYEIGRQLGKLGFAVVLAARNEEKIKESAERLRSEGLDAHAVVLDVTDANSVEAAAGWVEKSFGKLDVLVNNAGINLEFVSPPRPSELSGETLRSTFETNFFGVLTVTQGMLPLLRKSASPRVINQSSTLGSLAVLSDPKSPYYGINLLAYNSSKTALNGLSLALAKDLASERISVNAVCPGWVKTEMGTDAAPRNVVQGAEIAVRLATMENPPTGKYLDEAGEIPW